MCAATAVMRHPAHQAFHHPSEPVGAMAFHHPSEPVGAMAFHHPSGHPSSLSAHVHSTSSKSLPAAAPNTSDAEFDHLSIEELRGVLAQRDNMVHDLRQEIAALEREPIELQRRLIEMEKVFENITPADVLKLRSPVLRNISKAIREEHKNSHSLAPEEDVPDSILSYAESGEHFALGRGVMHIDRAQMDLEKEVKYEAARGNLVHPEDKSTAYAGHLGHPHGAASAVLVGPAGSAVGRQPLSHPVNEEFWLKAAGIANDQSGGAREAAPAVDRLGMAKLRRAAALEAVYGPGAAANTPGGALLAHHGPPQSASGRQLVHG